MWTNKCNVDGILWVSDTQPTECVATGAHTDIKTLDEGTE